MCVSAGLLEYDQHGLLLFEINTSYKLSLWVSLILWFRFCPIPALCASTNVWLEFKLLSADLRVFSLTWMLDVSVYC